MILDPLGQNLGINDVERAKQGVSKALRMSLLCAVVLTIPLAVWAPQLTAFFNSKAEVVRYGSLILRYADTGVFNGNCNFVSRFSYIDFNISVFDIKLYCIVKQICQNSRCR